MNLIEDAWIPITRIDGRKQKIAPWQITDQENPVADLDTPRPDFKGALYQFLIGLLQTGFAPEDHEQWLEYWEGMPEADKLRQRFSGLEPAFLLDNKGGLAFLQVFDLGEGEKKTISGLLIEAPGGKTMKDNLDFFIKRNTVTRLCPACTASALFTLQTNAPSGGVGHRVGLRGGGPLTTLIILAEDSPLWKKLWLNVLDEETFCKCISTPSPLVFPWLAPTRISTGKDKDTRPEDVHPLQMFWGMPRRIRIRFVPETGRCDLCGEETLTVAEEYITRNYGINYVGEWIHPLTPYRFDSKKKKPPLPLKGQQGGLGYRHWTGLTWADPVNGDCAARVTVQYIANRARDINGSRTAKLWCFGYDMDNMKARCWYDHTLPLFRLDENQRESVIAWAGELVNAARDVAAILRNQVKAAWFDRPKDARGDMGALLMDFYDRSEKQFYEVLNSLVRLPGSQRQAPPEIYDRWLKVLWGTAFGLFDAWVMDSPAEDLDMKRIVAAREGLKKQIKTVKSIKKLSKKADSEKEGA